MIVVNSVFACRPLLVPGRNDVGEVSIFLAKQINDTVWL